MSEARIRCETRADHEAIHALVHAAFEQLDEAQLVDALRAAGRVVLSLVAELEGRVVGHVLLSRCDIVDGDDRHPCLALAPVAVSPDLQRAGIGQALVREAVARASADSGSFVAIIVLGHPEYYPRFGFERADGHGIACPFEAPAEAFMVLPLRPGALAGLCGVVEYAPEFG